MEQSQAAGCFNKLERDGEEGRIKVQVFDSFEKLTRMQQRWDEFVESMGSEVFLTYDWCRTWWKYYGDNRRLRVFVFSKGDELVGIIPLFLEGVWLGPAFIRILKIVGSDFSLSQYSLPIRGENMAEVIEKFSVSLGSDKWDVLHIGPIAGLYSDYDNLKEAFDKNFGISSKLISSSVEVETYFHLAENWEAYLSSLSKRERGDIGRNYRYLKKVVDDPSAEVESCFITTDELEEVYADFLSMHQAHWHRLGKAGHFGDWPDSVDFHKEMAHVQLKNNRLRLLKTRMGKYVLGYEFMYKFGNMYLEFLNARFEDEALKSISVGKIVFSELVKKATEEKVYCVDSMRGEYEHKLRMGGKLYPMRDIYICKKGSLILVRVHVFRILARLFNLCYYKIWFCRIAPKLPFKRRPLWKLWIKTYGLV